MMLRECVQGSSMIPKSESRFLDKIMLKQKDRLGSGPMQSNQTLMFAALKRYG